GTDIDVPFVAGHMARMDAAIERADGVEADVRQLVDVAIDLCAAARTEVALHARRAVIAGQLLGAVCNDEIRGLDDRKAGEGGAVNAATDAAMTVADLVGRRRHPVADSTAVAAAGDGEFGHSLLEPILQAAEPAESLLDLRDVVVQPVDQVARAAFIVA